MKQICRRITAVLLVFVMLFAVAAVGSVANAVDLSKECSLKVKPGPNDKDYKDLHQEANLVLDIYKIADAVEKPGYDAYDYSLLDEYESLDLLNVHDNDDWQRIAQQATRIIKEGSVVPDISAAPINEQFEVGDPGLYLVIARGSDIVNYFSEKTDEEGNTYYITNAQTVDYIYDFVPVLVSLPNRDNANEENDWVRGEWQYDAPITLKPERTKRCGSLSIVKSLQEYLAGRPATFVFEIEAVKDGEVVYSNVVSISFDEAGTREALVENIPVGAVVTVREVYSGACYELLSEFDQITTIDTEDVTSVFFTNGASGSGRNGGSVTNVFTVRDGYWHWETVEG